MKAATIERDLTDMAKHAEKIRSDAPAAIGTMSVGDVVRQGDLYVIRIAKLPASAKLTNRPQLAPGTSQGSRHIMAGDARIYEADTAQVAAAIKSANGAEIPPELIGPVFVPNGAPVTIKHPEHGHRTLPAECIGAVVYQRAFADTVRRVRD